MLSHSKANQQANQWPDPSHFLSRPPSYEGRDEQMAILHHLHYYQSELDPTWDMYTWTKGKPKSQNLQNVEMLGHMSKCREPLQCKQLDMCTQSVQLNIGLTNKSLMGVLAHNTSASFKSTSVLPNIWAEQNVCTSIIFILCWLFLIWAILKWLGHFSEYITLFTFTLDQRLII